MINNGENDLFPKTKKSSTTLLKKQRCRKFCNDSGNAIKFFERVRNGKIVLEEAKKSKQT